MFEERMRPFQLVFESYMSQQMTDGTLVGLVGKYPTADDIGTKTAGTSQIAIMVSGAAVFRRYQNSIRFIKSKITIEYCTTRSQK
jgi:hypothetical protein